MNPTTIKESITKYASNPVLLVIVILILLVLLVWILCYYLLNFKCNTSIPSDLAINCSSINRADTDINPFNHTLKDYYIKTAYNCCNIGSYNNCYVKLDMLKYVLKQGCRCLDFAIYSIKGEPIVAASYLQNNTKTTINYILFSDVMSVLKDYAFSQGTSPNPDDPLIIHLRIYSDNSDMFTNLTQIMKQYNDLLLDPSFSWANKGNDNGITINYLGDVPLLQIPKRKILVIIQDNKQCIDKSCPFYEYVNLTSNSSEMHLFNYSDMKNQDLEELTTFNKQYISFIMPDVGDDPINPNFQTCIDVGCQFIAMRYQYEDKYLDTCTKTFNDNGYAFQLKPIDLRYIPEPLPPIIPQKESYSYATRTIDTPAGTLNI
jgi:hypothetical protein